jgi:hypothetical protein
LHTGDGSLLAAALILAVVGFSSPARALTEADLVLFPIGLPPAGASVVSTVDLIPIFQGSGYTYSIERTGVINPSGNNPDPSDPLTWTILQYDATITYVPGGGGIPVEELDSIANLILVYTSLREGPFDGVTLPPRIDGGYVKPGFSGTVSDPFYVLDPVGGAVTDAEGDLFLAFAFPVLPGAGQTFSFEIALREPLDDTLQQFNRGFLAPVPEPGTFLLFGLGLALLSGVRRARSS